MSEGLTLAEIQARVAQTTQALIQARAKDLAAQGFTSARERRLALLIAALAEGQEKLAERLDVLTEWIQRGGGAGPPAGLRPLEEIRARAQNETLQKASVDSSALYDKDAFEMDQRLGDGGAP